MVSLICANGRKGALHGRANLPVSRIPHLRQRLLPLSELSSAPALRVLDSNPIQVEMTSLSSFPLFFARTSSLIKLLSVAIPAKMICDLVTYFLPESDDTGVFSGKNLLMTDVSILKWAVLTQTVAGGRYEEPETEYVIIQKEE